MKKARSSYDLALLPKIPSTDLDLKFKNPMKYQSNSALFYPLNQQPTTTKMASAKGNNSKTDDSGKHKVVIYFSDAYNNICNKVNSVDDGNSDIDRHRFSNDVQKQQSSTKALQNSSKEFMAQLKTVLEEKSKFTNKFTDTNNIKGGNNVESIAANKFKPVIPEKPSCMSSSSSFHFSTNNMLQINQSSQNIQQNQQQKHEVNAKSLKLLPSFIESIDENNVIKLKIEQNFRKASELVSLISSLPKKSKKLKKVEKVGDCGRRGGGRHETSSIHELNFSHEGEMDCIEEICTEDDEEKEKDEIEEEEEDGGMSEPDEGYFYDWSFVQEWRSRPQKISKTGIDSLPSSAAELNKAKLTKTVNATHGQSSHHIIHAPSRASEAAQKDNRNNKLDSNRKIVTNMQNQQAVTTIAPKMAKEISLRPLGSAVDNGLPTSPINIRQNANDVKSPVRHFDSPSRVHCNSAAMIPERDVGPTRMPASPPHLTQATPSNATIVHPNYKPIPQRAVLGPTRGVTVQSTPVKAQPALISSSLAGKVFVPTSMSIANGNNGNNNISKIDVTTNGTDVVDKPKHFHAQNPTNLPAPQPTKQPISHHNNSINHHPPMPNHHQYNSNHAPQPPQQSVFPQQHQQQTPIKPKTSININVRTHHHNGNGSVGNRQECHSSSDENRSSGHASMSDTGGHGSSSPGSNKNGNGQLGTTPSDDVRLAAGVTSRNARSRASTGKARHRAVPLKNPWSGSGLEDIKTAIQQMTLRSQTSTSTYSSLSAGSESSEPARRLGRYSSLETVNTNVTSADEFVWVDSHNRLVELQHPPWSQYCLMRVIRTGRCKDFSDRVSAEAVPRLGYLLTRALVRISREIQRLSSVLGLCSKHEVAGAFKMVLCPALADSCTKASLRAAAMFALSGEGTYKQTKSARAGLQLPVGRFHRWMIDARLGKFVHEYAAVYLCAGFENLLEEILLQCVPSDPTATLTAMGLEHAIAGSGDLWGLLQPFVHLNAGRVASGALTMPRWTSENSVNPNNNHHSNNNASGILHPNNNNNINNLNAGNNNSKQEPCLLTTCVGTLAELKDLVNRAQKRSNHITMSQAALRELFYFMRCSQLEHNEANNNVGGSNSNNVNNHNNGSGSNAANNNNNGGNNIPPTSNSNNAITNNIQELCYERAYIVLPPLIEWLRVASAHAEYRHSTLIDRNDIMQAARLLLPGVDCPPRQILYYEELPSAKGYTIPPSMSYNNHGSISSNSSNSNVIDDYVESGRRATVELAFRMMLSGIPELLVQSMSVVSPTTRYDTLNHQGLTALMVAAILNDETAIQMLLDSGANPNVEVPTIGHPHCPAIHPETQNWTALTFAACRGNYQALRVLLERGSKIEGGARLSEEKCTFTPLQVASGSGCIENVSHLLAHGASSFLSTKQNSMAFSGKAQQGCFSAISVATAHGQRLTLRKLLSHPFVPEKQRDVLSLEEILAEGGDGNARSSHDRQNEVPPSLSKQQIRALQEAMYHSAENNYLDITIELRALGVPWTLHCWMHALAAAHELRLDTVIDQLLQDFLQVCPDDYSQQFVNECLPLLFSIFRYSKKEGTTLLLADIFSTCYGWESIKPIKENSHMQPVNGARIDPKFVNNSELSDVTFRVEGKVFYGHKIVLVTASPRLQSLLSSKVSEGNGTPTVQINDIRYHIFELVMQYLYSGGTHSLELSGNDADVLELMAAASFFQLEGLLRYTEARCAEIIDIDNVVAMYIHAKVYNASKLMEYCQGFLLQNMVALLTYDDSVKRLLFAKKIPNHDVLSGLLTTLQKRIETRRISQTNLSQNVIKPATSVVPMNGKTSHNLSTTNNINNNSSVGMNKSGNNNLNE